MHPCPSLGPETRQVSMTHTELELCSLISCHLRLWYLLLQLRAVGLGLKYLGFLKETQKPN